MRGLGVVVVLEIGLVACGGSNPPPQTALDANLIDGEKNIVSDDVIKTEISRSRKDKLIGSYKLCLTADGNIASVTQVKSTGFQAYDSKIISTIRAEWRYRPFVVNGKAVPVCTVVTFIYTQKPAVPPSGPALPAAPPPPPPPPPPPQS